MKLYAPAYYTTFSCIADRCTHSCCVGWEIGIDAETEQKYRQITHPYGERIRESIVHDGDAACFRLDAAERCPHLAENGLCQIITELGEGYLCEICREHPRFYNRTARGLEVGLGMACEEACRVILAAEDFTTLCEIGEVDADPFPPTFDALTHREKILSILSDPSRSLIQKRSDLHSSYQIPPFSGAEQTWRTHLGALEYLDSAHRAMFAGFLGAPDTPQALEAPLCRALAYLVFRHCTAANSESDLRERVGLCLLCERLIASLAFAAGVHEESALIPLARTVSEEIEYSEENTEALKRAFSP